jgi:D-alanyl-D-alanine carboxypeptidase (penicillin-binding protein 5/6)
MLPSGADATNSIAISSFGSIDGFVNKMNEKVKEIGLSNTHFVNVSGLDAEGHYSTADDVRKLLEYSLKNDTFKKIYTTKSYELTNGLKVKSSINYYNSLLKTDTSKILGSKTGFTYNAGYCLSSLSNINGHEVLIIVLKASKQGKDYYNIIDTVNLIDFLNKNYKYEVLTKKEDLIVTIPVYLSNIDEYNVYSDEDVKKYLPSDYDKSKYKIEYDGLKKLSFANKGHKEIGTVKYYYGDDILYEQKVLLDTSINTRFKKIIKKYLYLIIILVILLIVIFVLSLNKKKKKRK